MLNASYLCPFDQCMQAAGALLPSPPCFISRLGSAMSAGAAPPCVDFARFEARKRHKAALLVGNGPSVNLISDAHAQLIGQSWDVWATNQFFVHRTLTPDFHHLEIKGYTEPFWVDNFDEAARHRYRERSTLLWGFGETKYFRVNPSPGSCRLENASTSEAIEKRSFGHSCGTSCLRCLERVLLHVGLLENTYIYNELAFGEGVRNFRACKPSAPLHPHVLNKRCAASLTVVLSMILHLRYEKLYLLGVDLATTAHFFDVAPEYSGTLYQPHLTRSEAAQAREDATRQKKHAAASLKHATANAMVEFLPGFFEASGLTAINLSPDSLLVRTCIPTLSLAAALNRSDDHHHHHHQDRPPPHASTTAAGRGSRHPAMSQRTPLLLHRIAPRSTSIWDGMISSWDALNATTTVYGDEQLLPIIMRAFPALAPTVASTFRTLVEKTDIARLALVYLYGGIYSDLDIELKDVGALRAMLSTGLTYLPLEKQRLIGQSILVSPPRHPLWARLAYEMVHKYDGRCYETMNTGPDRFTELFNEWCADALAELQDVVVHDGLITGGVTWHHATGKRTWKKSRNEAYLRKSGKFGCRFRKARLAFYGNCTRSDDALKEVAGSTSSPSEATNAMTSCLKREKQKEEDKRKKAALAAPININADTSRAEPIQIEMSGGGGGVSGLRLDAVMRVEKPSIAGVQFESSPSGGATEEPLPLPKYDNVISINSVRVGGGGGGTKVSEVTAARLCDGGCVNGKHISASTLLIGDVSCGAARGVSSSGGGAPRSSCSWRSRAREVHLAFAYSAARVYFNGPEDARLDVVQVQGDDGPLEEVFALANVPSEPNASCGGSSWAAQKRRDMAFVPLGSAAAAARGGATSAAGWRACRIQAAARADPCQREKNWASLVVESAIYLVYSTTPFQVLRFSPSDCHATLVANREGQGGDGGGGGGDGGGDTPPQTILPPDLAVRGSTRYVFGVRTGAGDDVYWGLVHVQRNCTFGVMSHSKRLTRCRYDHFISAVLVKRICQKPTVIVGDGEDDGERAGSCSLRFAHLGLSPPLANNAIITKAGETLPSFLYIHSIVSYDEGVAEVGFHVDDQENFRARLLGVPVALAELVLHHQARQSRAARRRGRNGGGGRRRASRKAVSAPAAREDELANKEEPAVTEKPAAKEEPPPIDTAANPPRSNAPPARVALVTDIVLADELHASAPKPVWLQRAMDSVSCYASRHGYAYYPSIRQNYSHEESAFVEPSLLQKTSAVRRRLMGGGHEWVVWVDYDVLVMNGTVRLEPLLDAAVGFDVIVGDGGDEVNAGIFAVRSSAGGRRFLEQYERDAARAAALKGHLPWRDNGYLIHAVLRGLVEDAGEEYSDECLMAGLHGSKKAFRTCFWRYRQRLHHLTDDQIDGPPRYSRAPSPNASSGASYRVYLSRDGVLNNILAWPEPNNYAPGDLLLHFAGPNKSAISDYVESALAC